MGDATYEAFRLEGPQWVPHGTLRVAGPTLELRPPPPSKEETLDVLTSRRAAGAERLSEAACAKRQSNWGVWVI